MRCVLGSLTEAKESARDAASMASDLVQSEWSTEQERLALQSALSIARVAYASAEAAERCMIAALGQASALAPAVVDNVTALLAPPTPAPPEAAAAAAALADAATAAPAPPEAAAAVAAATEAAAAVTVDPVTVSHAPAPREAAEAARSVTAQVDTLAFGRGSGFPTMREMRGVFWPRPIYRQFFRKDIPPDNLLRIRDMEGIILPRNPSRYSSKV